MERNIKKIQQEYNITEEELTGGKEELKKKIDRENRNQFEMNIKRKLKQNQKPNTGYRWTKEQYQR